MTKKQKIPVFTIVSVLRTQNENTDRRNIPGSISFVPPVAGTLIAYQVAKDLMETKEAPENQREDNPFVKDKRPSAHNL